MLRTSSYKHLSVISLSCYFCNASCFINFKVYQEKAVKDKERYRAEMEDYRGKLKMGHVISDAVPLQQRLPDPDTDMVDADIKLDETEFDSLQTPEESSSGGSDYEDDKAMDKDFDVDASHVIGERAESSCLGSEKSLEGGL